MMGLWFLMHRDLLSVPIAFPPVAWHAHELLFGYVAAPVTGFLLTAVSGWTRRPPVAGWLLFALFGLWVAGRLAVNFSFIPGYLLATGLSIAFPVAVMVVVGREIIAGQNWRNLKVVGLLAAFTASHAVYSWAVWHGDDPVIGTRMAIASVLLLLTLVAGRIVPSFTANWLEARGETVMPAPHARYDSVVVGVGALGLALWVVDGWVVPAGIVGTILLGSAGLHLVRQFRWRPHRTLADPLVAVLHGAYLFVPVGFALSGLALIRGAGERPSRRCSRLDGGRLRHHDPGGHDAGKPRAHRTVPPSLAGHGDHLPVGPVGSRGTDRRPPVSRVEPVAVIGGGCRMDCCLPELRCRVRADAPGAAPGGVATYGGSSVRRTRRPSAGACRASEDGRAERYRTDRVQATGWLLHPL